jgi:hypothetical protein
MGRWTEETGSEQISIIAVYILYCEELGMRQS